MFITCIIVIIIVNSSKRLAARGIVIEVNFLQEIAA